MTLTSQLAGLVEELDKIHSPDFSWPEKEFPDFVTARNGRQRFFTSKARAAVLRVATMIHQNRPVLAVRIEIAPFMKVVLQAVADMHAEGMFANGAPNVTAALKELTEVRVEERSKDYTHHFPAWTLGIEKNAPFTLGPVCFLSTDSWVDHVNYSPQAIESVGDDPEANRRWKEDLKRALSNTSDGAAMPLLAGWIYNSVHPCPAVLSVTVRSYEMELSRKLARLVCKTALDATSLSFWDPNFFRQQALQDERLPPFSTSGIIEVGGVLGLPGLELSRVPSLSPKDAQAEWAKRAIFHGPISSVIMALVNPSSHPHPQLASRWATALDWFGDGCRETSDSIALAKLGTSLDVLSNGGKYTGILEMVSHLTGRGKEEQVVSSSPPMTMAQVIKSIYDHGRSQILHGSHYDRLKPFSKERALATQVANKVLLEAVLRLSTYGGDDNDAKAFRTMPSVAK